MTDIRRKSFTFAIANVTDTILLLKHNSLNIYDYSNFATKKKLLLSQSEI